MERNRHRVGPDSVGREHDFDYAAAGQRARQRADVDLIQTDELALRQGAEYGYVLSADGDRQARKPTDASPKRQQDDLVAFWPEVDRRGCQAGVEDCFLSSGAVGKPATPVPATVVITPVVAEIIRTR